jgi:hypothetical protein
MLKMSQKSQILLDTTKVAGAAIGATAIKLADVNTALTTVSILLAIAYTTYKWLKESKK